MYGFPTLCISEYILNKPTLLNVAKHTSHFKSFSPLCILERNFNVLAVVNYAAENTSHVYCFFSLCILECVFNCSKTVIADIDLGLDMDRLYVMYIDT